MGEKVLYESIKPDNSKSSIKSIFLWVGQKTAIGYNFLIDNYSLIILAMIAYAFVSYLDIYILPKHIFGTEIITKVTLAFLIFAGSIIYISYMTIYLLFTKPFANNFDKKLLSIGFGIFIYKIIPFYKREYAIISWTAFLYIVFFIFVVFLMRWILASANLCYMENIKKYYSEGINKDSCFKADKPIEVLVEDALERSNYANELAKAIVSYEEKDSLVVALTGEWGSGKSSIINMSIESIEKNFHYSKYINPTIVRFLPWNFSNQNQLLDQFFKSMSHSLNANKRIIKNQALEEKIAAYVAIFGKLVATYGVDVANFSGFTSNIKNSLFFSDVDIVRSFLEAKESLADVLRTLPSKIIIFIDDIDRLNSNEIKQIFQLIKTIADFPNTIYVLSFDNKVVTSVINADQKHLEASNYLEKIVQVNLEIPLVNQRKVEKILFDGLNPLILDISNDLFNINHWENVYQKGLKQYIKNIRDAKRILNSMRFQYNLVKNEVNFVDFFALIVLQVFEYDLYCLIRENRLKIAGGWTDESGQGAEKKELEVILDDMKKTSNINVLPLLCYLFPKLELITANKTYGHSFETEWRRSCRICSPDVIDVYFKLDIDSNEISKIELRELIQSTSDILLFKKNLNIFVTDGRIIRVLELLEDYTSETDASGRFFILEENIENVITTLLDMGDTFPEVNNEGFFTVPNSLRIARLVHQLTSRIKSQKERGTLIIRCLDNAKNSLSSSVYIIRLYDQEHGKLPLGRDAETEEQRTVSPEDLCTLEKIGLKRIEQAAKNGTLYLNNNFSTILFGWSEWASIDIVRGYIDKNLKSDEFFIELIKGFINIVTIYGINESSMKHEKSFELGSFKKIVNNIDVIRERALELLDNENLNAEQKGNLEVFIKATEISKK